MSQSRVCNVCGMFEIGDDHACSNIKSGATECRTCENNKLKREEPIDYVQKNGKTYGEIKSDDPDEYFGYDVSPEGQDDVVREQRNRYAAEKAKLKASALKETVLKTLDRLAKMSQEEITAYLDAHEETNLGQMILDAGLFQAVTPETPANVTLPLRRMLKKAVEYYAPEKPEASEPSPAQAAQGQDKQNKYCQSCGVNYIDECLCPKFEPELSEAIQKWSAAEVKDIDSVKAELAEVKRERDEARIIAMNESLVLTRERDKLLAALKAKHVDWLSACKLLEKKDAECEKLKALGDNLPGYLHELVRDNNDKLRAEVAKLQEALENCIPYDQVEKLQLELGEARTELAKAKNYDLTSAVLAKDVELKEQLIRARAELIEACAARDQWKSTHVELAKEREKSAALIQTLDHALFDMSLSWERYIPIWTASLEKVREAIAKYRERAKHD